MAITITADVASGDSVFHVSGVTTQHAPFRAQIDGEQVDVDSASALVWGMVHRGVNGTSRAAHTSGATIIPLSAVEQTGAPLASPITNPNVSLVAPLDFSATTPAGGTAGDLVTTGTTWVVFSGAGACGVKLLLENDCATGEFATLRMRARYGGAATASGDGGASIGTTTCYDASASANHADYGNLKAVNACAQPNAFAQTTDATNIVTALYGRIDATAASVGRRWVGWLDTHATTKADAGDYMQRISHNGTVANDGVWTIYNGGRLPQLFNFEDVAGFLSTSATTFTKTHKIAVKIAGDATQYYIQVGTVA
jgi:hypothetical protein